MFVDPRPPISGVPPKSDLQLLQELVHTLDQVLGLRLDTMHTWLPLIDHHLVLQIGLHDKVMLDDKLSFLLVQDVTLDHLLLDNPLFDIQVLGRFIKEVKVLRFSQLND